MKRTTFIPALLLLLTPGLAFAAPSTLRPAPRSLAVSRNLLVRPVQKMIGKRLVARSSKDGTTRQRSAYYRYDKVTNKLVQRLVGYKEARADGSKLESLHLRLPRAKRVSQKQLDKSLGDKPIRSILGILRSVDVKETKLTKADGTIVKKIVFGFSDARVKTIEVTTPDGKKRSTTKTSQRKTPEQRAADKAFWTRSFDLTKRIKARRAELRADKSVLRHGGS